MTCIYKASLYTVWNTFLIWSKDTIYGMLRPGMSTRSFIIFIDEYFAI